MAKEELQPGDKVCPLRDRSVPTATSFICEWAVSPGVCGDRRISKHSWVGQDGVQETKATEPAQEGIERALQHRVPALSTQRLHQAPRLTQGFSQRLFLNY